MWQSRRDNQARSQIVRQVISQRTSDSEESLLSLSITKKGKHTTPQAELLIQDTKITFSIDTGASATIIDETTFKKLAKKPMIRMSKVPIYGYCSETPLSLIGEFDTKLKHDKTEIDATIRIVRGEAGCLLS